MYGYIKPNNLELKVREYYFYRSVYCGLCRSLSKHTGGLSSMTLSYDMTFFALVRMILTKEEIKIKRKHCILHPFTKRNIVQDSKALTYTSYVSSVLFHDKVKDNIKDESFIRKIISFLTYPFSSAFKNRNKIKFINETVNKHMSVLSSKEDNKCSSCDEIASVFGEMMGDLISYDLPENEKRIAYEIGIHTGRWMYLSDALCDYKKDVKKKRYNPYIYSFKDEEEKEEYFSSGYKVVLESEINAIRTCLDLLDIEYNELKSCAYNIVENGMMTNFELIYKKERGIKDEQPI